MKEAIEALHERLSKLEAENALATTLLAALIRVAPDQTAVHLAMTMAFESAAGPRAGPFRNLTDGQIQYARDLLEHMGTLATRFPTRFPLKDDDPNGPS